MTTCPHGEPSPSCCIDCLEGPPAPAKVARTRIDSTYESNAQYVTFCARDVAHTIEPGDLIRLTELGWCCVECASSPPGLRGPA